MDAYAQHDQRVQLRVLAFGEWACPKLRRQCVCELCNCAFACSVCCWAWPATIAPTPLLSGEIDPVHSTSIVKCVNSAVPLYVCPCVCSVAWWLLFITMYTARLPVHAYLLFRVLSGSDNWPSSLIWAAVYALALLLGCCRVRMISHLSLHCRLVLLAGFNMLNVKLNMYVLCECRSRSLLASCCRVDVCSNVSSAYEKALNKANSKRTWAISMLASWVWPVGSLLAGALLWFVRK